MSSQKSSSSSPQQKTRILKLSANVSVKQSPLSNLKKDAFDFDFGGNSNGCADASALRKKNSANSIFDHYFSNNFNLKKSGNPGGSSERREQKYFFPKKKEEGYSLLNSPRLRTESMEESFQLPPTNNFLNSKPLIKRRNSKEVTSKTSEKTQYFFDKLRKQPEKLPLTDLGRSALLSREDARFKKEIESVKLFSQLYVREGGSLLGFYEKDLQKVRESFLKEDPVTNRLVLIGCDAINLVKLERKNALEDDFAHFAGGEEFIQEDISDPSLKGERRKTVELASWIKHMFSSIKKSRANGTGEIFQNVQVVLGAAVTELSRLIKLNCSEQATLLNKMWQKNQEITTCLIMELKSLITDYLLTNEKGAKELHASYIKRLEAQSAEKEKLALELDVMSKDLETLKQNYEYSKKKIERSENEKAIMSKQYQTLEKEFARLLKIIKKEEEEEKERRSREKSQKELLDAFNSYQKSESNFQRVSKRERSYRYIEEIVDSFSEVTTLQYKKNEFLGVEEKGTATDPCAGRDQSTSTESLVSFVHRGCDAITDLPEVSAEVLRKHKAVGTENKILKEVGVVTESVENEKADTSTLMNLRSLNSLDSNEGNLLSLQIPSSSLRKHPQEISLPSLNNISLSLTPAPSEYGYSEKSNIFSKTDEIIESSSEESESNGKRKDSSDIEKLSSSDAEEEENNNFFLTTEGSRRTEPQSLSKKNDLISNFDFFINYLKKHQSRVEELIAPHLFGEKEEAQPLRSADGLINNSDEMKNFLQKLFNTNNELKATSKKVEDIISVSKKKEIEKGSLELFSPGKPNPREREQLMSFSKSSLLSPKSNAFVRLRSPVHKNSGRDMKEKGFGFAMPNEAERTSVRSSTMMVSSGVEKRKFFYNVSSNFEMAAAFVAKAPSFKPSNKKVKSKSDLLKFIKLMYLEKIRQLKTREKGNPLHVVAYDVFFKRYNFQAIVEAKLQGLVEGALYYANNVRVKHFLSFFGLGESYENEDFDLYVRFLEKMEETAVSSETSIMYQFCKSNKPFVVLSKMKEVASKLWESNMYPKLLQSFLEKIDKMKAIEIQILVNASANVKTAVLSLDPVLALILEFNVKNRDYILNFLKPVYLAGDINEDHSIGFQEFLILIRHIERGKYTLLQAVEAFYDKCDLMDREKGEREMTFKNFALMAFEKGLFSEGAQKEFLENLDGLSIKSLQQKWNKEKQFIENRFSKAEKLTEFHSDMITKIETVLAQNINEEDKTIQVKTAGIVLRLLEEDSKWAVADKNLADILGEELLTLDGFVFSAMRRGIMLRR